MKSRWEALRALGNTAPIALHLGMEIKAVEQGEARVELPFSPPLMQAHGRVHGGVYGLLADTAGYFAAASCYDTDGVTVEYKLNLLQGAVGEDLVAIGKVLQAGRRIAICEVDVRTTSGALVAKALATYRFSSRNA